MLPIWLLVACAAAPGNPPGRCDFEGQSGICISVDPDAKRPNMRAFEAAYLQARRDVEKRYGVDVGDVSGPTVRVVSYRAFAGAHPIANRLDGDMGGDHGWTDFRSGEITLTGVDVMRHEAFHYLLWRAGYSNVLNAAHEHAAFDEYRDGQWLPRRQNASVLESR